MEIENQWAMMLFGMDEDKAELLADYARKQLALGAEPVDPRIFYVMVADRTTMTHIRRQISADPNLEAVVESIDEWLNVADEDG